jgi:hypothetical protein
MIWKKEKNKKIKYTFKKVTEFSNNNGKKNGNEINNDSIFSNDQIIITTALNKSVDFEMKGTGRAIIDWGNGEREMSNPLYSTDESYMYRFLPTNSSSVSNITITGNVTYLKCNGLAKLDVRGNPALTKLVCKGYVTELDVSKNVALTHLEYNGYEYGKSGLTGLDVSKNTALAYLDCSYNQFSALALNALFETLHDNPISGGKDIYITLRYENADCDISIAEKKGWRVH